jgi:hypothetical protein
MTADIESSNSSEYKELLSFLSHKNVAVQSQALKVLSSYSGDPDTEFINLILSQPEAIVRPVLRLVETDDKELVEDGLTTLVNLATIDSVCEAMIRLAAIRRICDSLNQRQVMIELHCMLLSNLTRLASGVDDLLNIPGLFKGVVLKYAAVDSEEVDHLGSVIINGTSSNTGRRILCELQTDSQGYTHCLLLQCLARSLTVRRRRVTILHILRNLALDTECHDAIAASGILINICYFLYPEREGRREDDVHKSITENGIGLASDIETRTVSAEFLVCFLRSEIGRDVMRTVGLYEVVRLWDLEESEQSIKDMLYDVAMATHLNEEELKTGELQDKPDKIVEL